MSDPMPDPTPEPTDAQIIAETKQHAANTAARFAVMGPMVPVSIFELHTILRMADLGVAALMREYGIDPEGDNWARTLQSRIPGYDPSVPDPLEPAMQFAAIYMSMVTDRLIPAANAAAAAERDL